MSYSNLNFSDDNLNWSDVSNEIHQLDSGSEAEADISTFSENQSIDQPSIEAISTNQTNPPPSQDTKSLPASIPETVNLILDYNNNQQQYTMTNSPAINLLLGVAPLSTKRDKDAVLSLSVSVRKEDRKDLKEKDKKTYQKVKENGTKGIENKFTQLKAIDENSPIEHFESVYSVVTRLDDLQESLRVNDEIGVFTIASAYHADGSGPTDEAVTIDMFHDKDADMGLVKLANQYFYEYGQDYHGENVAWSGEKILNSCDETLRDKLIESTRGWSPLHKGGPTYLKLLMGLIVATSKKSLRSLLNKVSSLKLTDFNGEDVGRAVSFLRGASLILRDNDALPSDFLTLILNIFKQTTCAPFSAYVTTLEHNVDLGVTTIEADDVLRLFENKYIDMLGRTEWTPKSITKDQQSGFYSGGGSLNLMCFNCGGLGHSVKECKLPINQEHIDARRDLVFNRNDRRKNQSGSKNNKAGDSLNNNNNNGGGGGSDKKQNALTTPPKSGESDEKTVNGTKLFWCTKCAKWTDHKTDEHQNSSTNDPQGNLANDKYNEDIGDDSGNQETGSYAEVTGFLSSSSINF